MSAGSSASPFVGRRGRILVRANHHHHQSDAINVV